VIILPRQARDTNIGKALNKREMRFRFIGSGASHGNLGPLETFLGYYLNTIAGMGGPEIAGELYKVFKAWLHKRILQGSLGPAAAAAAGGGGRGDGEGDDGEGEGGGVVGAAPTTAPTTPEGLALVVTEALAVSDTRAAAATSLAPLCALRLFAMLHHVSVRHHHQQLHHHQSPSDLAWSAVMT
jgi:hypothetical protein